MSNILERHLEQNIEPTINKESYIDKAIQIFQDMKEEDMETTGSFFKSGNKYCLAGLFSHMNGCNGTNSEVCNYAKRKLGVSTSSALTMIHIRWANGGINFEQMRSNAIEYMESLK